MITLHAIWLPETPRIAASLVIWGERYVSGSRRSAGVGSTQAPPSASPHPFAASHTEIRRALPHDCLAWLSDPVQVSARLPSIAGSPLPSWQSGREVGNRPLLATWAVPAITVNPHDAIWLLTHISTSSGVGPGLVLAGDVDFWRAAARFALSILAGQRFRPALRGQNGNVFAVWHPLLDSPEDVEHVNALAGAMPPVSRAVTWDEESPPQQPRQMLDDFLSKTVDACARKAVNLRIPRSRGSARTGEDWLRALVDENARLAAAGEFIQQFQSWTHPSRIASTDTFRVCFRLDPPSGPSVTGNGVALPDPGSSDWVLRYFLQATDDPSLLVPAEAVWRERGSALAFLNRVFDQPQERLLMALGLAASLFPPIEASLGAARPEECRLTTGDAYQFIRETAVLLQSQGFGVLMPDLAAQLGIRVKLSPGSRRSGASGGVAGISFDSILNFNWELALGGEPLSEQEFDKLADLKVPLVRIRGQWVELRPEQVEQLLKAWGRRKGDNPELTLADAIRWALAPDGLAGLPVTEVVTDGWVQELMEELTDRRQLSPVPVPGEFTGVLRPYQKAGLSWLAFLHRYGLGACLADDMGLGKTIQTIALLLHKRNGRPHKPALLICPMSVVSNWQHEVARFAPSLRVMVHHGGKRAKEDFAGLANQHDLVITSFALLPRDEKHLAGVQWGDVIVDEAQNIKNPDTKQARAVRTLPAQNRLALTGTPVENRLSELWSILHFLNPGYLGTKSEFQERFARPIERAEDSDAASRLKSLVGPFILRRVKTDPSVIADLPAKNEMKVFCPLTKEQATLYEAVVRDSLRQIEEAEGIARRGIVLATLMKLKQVCNHPAQLLKDGSTIDGRSGKLARLTEMMDEVRQSGEHALIFTQFADMGRMLKSHLEASIGDDVLFLHGGTARKARDAMIDRFQHDPYAPSAFVLSLKAGGTGLNLTRASQVFHFDRWWNPAVEDQATDRAFRIGQTRNVQVYKFLCTGTMEERIDEMIERKKALSEAIVGTSEDWITELSTEDLREIFQLRKEAVSV